MFDDFSASSSDKPRLDPNKCVHKWISQLTRKYHDQPVEGIKVFGLTRFSSCEMELPKALLHPFLLFFGKKSCQLVSFQTVPLSTLFECGLGETASNYLGSSLRVSVFHLAVLSQGDLNLVGFLADGGQNRNQELHLGIEI